MHMKMRHFLPAALAGVDHGTEAVFQTLIARQFGSHHQHLAEQGGMAIPGLGQRSQMQLRDQHEMHRRDRVDVVERQQLVVLIHLAAGNLAAHYFAENAVAHAQSFFRLSFSAMPDRPSRRASSFSTSSALRPCLDSSTMQWNHRSAVSYTRWVLSPPLLARTTSVASSPIFFRMASSPLLNSLAT